MIPREKNYMAIEHEKKIFNFNRKCGNGDGKTSRLDGISFMKLEYTSYSNLKKKV